MEGWENPAVLDLQDRGLSSEQLGAVIAALSDDECLSVQRLYAANNALSSLPIVVTRLSNLQLLYLGGNQLRALPAWLNRFSHLETLYVSANHLEHLAPEVGQLRTLRKLSLHTNELSSLPTSLTGLLNLEVLYLSNNPLPAYLAVNTYGEAQALLQGPLCLYFRRNHRCRKAVYALLLCFRRSWLPEMALLVARHLWASRGLPVWDPIHLEPPKKKPK